MEWTGCFVSGLALLAGIGERIALLPHAEAGRVDRIIGLPIGLRG